jgi:hypothetical protein
VLPPARLLPLSLAGKSEEDSHQTIKEKQTKIIRIKQRKRE